VNSKVRSPDPQILNLIRFLATNNLLFQPSDLILTHSDLESESLLKIPQVTAIFITLIQLFESVPGTNRRIFSTTNYGITIDL